LKRLKSELFHYIKKLVNDKLAEIIGRAVFSTKQPITLFTYTCRHMVVCVILLVLIFMVIIIILHTTLNADYFYAYSISCNVVYLPTAA
jgi:hypothetical protein